MKKILLTLCTIAALAGSAFAGGPAPRAQLIKTPSFEQGGPSWAYFCAHSTYEQRTGHPRFTNEELAQRQREDEDYERNGQLYERLDQIESDLEDLKNQQDDQP